MLSRTLSTRTGLAVFAVAAGSSASAFYQIGPQQSFPIDSPDPGSTHYAGSSISINGRSFDPVTWGMTYEAKAYGYDNLGRTGIAVSETSGTIGPGPNGPWNGTLPAPSPNAGNAGGWPNAGRVRPPRRGDPGQPPATRRGTGHRR